MQQGSSFSPTLFIIYINDLLLKQPDGIALAYADDITLLTSGPTAFDAQFSFQRFLQTVHQWLVVNSLYLNSGKLHVMYISLSLRKRQPIALDLTIGAQHLSVVQQLTVLGVIISDDLSWDSQSRKVRAKISSCIAAICRFGRSLNFNTRLIAFNAFICHHLDYCLPVWGNSSLSIIKVMDKVLVRCARVIHGQCDIKLSSLTMTSCSLCDFATLVFMSNIIAMFYQLRSSASSCHVQLD